VFAGDGPERARLELIAAELKLRDSVHFLGAVSNPADVLAAADVFVLPSLVEGLPLALLEAMRAGKPIVATSVGGVPEAVTSGINGLLVAPADDLALADAIATLAASPRQRAELGDQARATADRDFTEQRYIGALVSLYDELLAR
jgi:glycosyltransferase involved in cell wall biosynthesis